MKDKAVCYISLADTLWGFTRFVRQRVTLSPYFIEAMPPSRLSNSMFQAAKAS